MKSFYRTFGMTNRGSGFERASEYAEGQRTLGHNVRVHRLSRGLYRVYFSAGPIDPEAALEARSDAT